MHQALRGPQVHCYFIFDTVFLNFPREKADGCLQETCRRHWYVCECVCPCTTQRLGSILTPVVPVLASCEAGTKLWPSPHFPGYCYKSSCLSRQRLCCWHRSVINTVPVLLREPEKAQGTASFTGCHWVNWDLFTS